MEFSFNKMGEDGRCNRLWNWSSIKGKFYHGIFVVTVRYVSLKFHAQDTNLASVLKLSL